MGYRERLALVMAFLSAGVFITGVQAHGRSAADLVRHIELLQLHDHGDGTPVEYAFVVNVWTDPAVTEIGILTPNGTELTIPDAAHTSAGTEHTWRIERPPDRRQWVYQVRDEDNAVLEPFGDGRYTVTATTGRDEHSTGVWFARSGSHTPLPQPVTPPTILSPAAAGRITSPVVVSWAPFAEPGAESAYVSVTAVSDPFLNLVSEPVSPGSHYVSGPHDLAAPGTYAVRVSASSTVSDVSLEGVPYRVVKGCSATRALDIEPRAAGTVAIGQTAYGRIDSARETDTFTFSADAGDHVVIDVNSDALYSSADLCLRVAHQNGSIVRRDADSGDMAGAYYAGIVLRGWLQAQGGQIGYDFWAGAWPLDPRTTLWFAGAGTYTIEIGTEEWLRDREDGPFGQGYHYELNVLDANSADLPPAADTVVRLRFPDGTERGLNTSHWQNGDGWQGYKYELWQGDLSEAEAAQFCPPGDYAFLARRRDGVTARRDLTVTERPPLSPPVATPLPDADDVVEPVYVRWGDVNPGVDYLSVSLYYADTWDEVWSLNLPLHERDLFVPANRTNNGVDYELNVVSFLGDIPEPKLELWQEMRTWLNFRTAPTQFSLAGVIAYDGRQPGPILVQAMLDSEFTGEIKGWQSIPGPGPYAIEALAGGHTYFVRAFVDADGNGVPGLHEAYGEYRNDGRPPAGVLVDLHVQDIDIQLGDVFGDTDQLPDWWEMEHFKGLHETDDGNPDNDPFSNLEEYRRGSDPGVTEGGEPLNLAVGWNLISLPSRVINPVPANLFPAACTGPLWTWHQDHYIPVADDAPMSPKCGYWIYVPAGAEGEVLLLLDATRAEAAASRSP